MMKMRKLGVLSVLLLASTGICVSGCGGSSSPSPDPEVDDRVIAADLYGECYRHWGKGDCPPGEIKTHSCHPFLGCSTLCCPDPNADPDSDSDPNSGSFCIQLQNLQHATTSCPNFLPRKVCEAGSSWSCKCCQR